MSSGRPAPSSQVASAATSPRRRLSSSTRPATHSTAQPPAEPHPATFIDAFHPICRGGYAAIVLSGRADVLDEIAGEPTAYVRWKFVMVDPALQEEEDFARSPAGAMLRQWQQHHVRPIDGVCFVFTNAEHPALQQLISAGAKSDEHFIITAGMVDARASRDLATRLADLVRRARQDRPIVILGYGDQGRCIARILRDDLAIPSDRLHIHDRSEESLAAAVRDGLHASADDNAIERAGAVIASPLARYASLAGQLDRAILVGLPVFDNARSSSGLKHWIANGRVLLDEAAARSVRVELGNDGPRIVCDEPALRPLLRAAIVREDERVLAGVHLPHLQSLQTHAFAQQESLDLASQWSGDGLSPATFRGLRRAFVSLGDRADLGFFAARELCVDLWPKATRAIFPAQHAIDLGATAFERLLQGHLHGREIAATMQTPAQRVTLGVAAAHYAASDGGGRPIIEIGSAFGGSALLMAAATERVGEMHVNRREGAAATIISIDPDAPTRDIMRFAFEREGCLNRLQQVIKTSDQAIADLQHLREACGLVFIDGLHTREAVEHDFQNYAPLIAIGGTLVLHDVCPAIHSVMQAVVQHVLPDKRFRAKCLVDGLLVLERMA